MKAVASALVLFVALQHVGFLVLEMFLWTKPVGLRVFRQSAERAQASAVLAMNQGLYNGFLAAGLFWGLLAQPPDFATAIRIFFLGCVIAAGVFGGITASRGIFFVQAVPGLVALLAVLAAR